MPRPTRYALLCASMLFFALLMGSGDSHAQLLNNTEFDTDVSGWAVTAKVTIEWDPLDADGSPTSGSGLVTNISDTAGDSTGASQCPAGINEEHTYQVGAEVYIPGGQTETGWADILVRWYSGANCSGLIDLANTSSVTTATPDTWLPVSGSFVAPAGSQSARVRLSVRKQEDTGNLAAHFDNVVFADAALIFQDGFESGDTTAWSNTVP